jgi:hypothetical protein
VRRRTLLVAAQLAFAALVVWFVVHTLAPHWDGVRDRLTTVRPRWVPLIAASALVLFTHALLIQTWRSVLRAWSSPLSFVDAARVWSVSNLARFLPGPAWQIGAMSALAKREGASGMAAAGSSIIIAIVNVLVGFAIVFATGARVLEEGRSGGIAAGVAAAATALVAVLTLPIVVPWAAGTAARLTKRSLAVTAVPPRIIWITAAGTGAQWLLYGVAFKLFAIALLGDDATGALLPYLAVYTSAYLVGYVNPLAPGGFVVRELAIGAGMVAFGLASEPDAAFVAVASRLWLTLLEVVPGLLFLAAGAASRSPHLPNDVPS